MIESLQLRNFKGSSVGYKFTGKDILVAKNFRGKTAVLDGIRLSALGYVPGINRSRAAIMELSSGTPMQAFVTLTGKPGVFGAEFGKKAAEDKVVAMSLPESALMLFDQTLLLKASKPERAKMAALYLGAEDAASAEKIIATLKAAAIKKPTEDTEKALSKLVASIQSDKGFKGAETAADRIQTADELISAALSAANANSKRMATTAQGNTDLSTEAGGDIMASAHDIEAEIERAQQAKQDQASTRAVRVSELAALRKNLAELEQLKAASASDVRSELEAALAGVRENITTETARLAELDANIKQANEELSAMRAEIAEGKRKANEAMQAASVVIDAANDAGVWVSAGGFTIPDPDIEFEFRARGKVLAGGGVEVTEFLQFLKRQPVDQAALEKANNDHDQAASALFDFENQQEDIDRAGTKVENMQSEASEIRDSLPERRKNEAELTAALQADNGPRIQALNEIIAKSDTVETHEAVIADCDSKIDAVNSAVSTLKETLEKIRVRQRDQERIDAAIAASQATEAEIVVCKAMAAALKQLRTEIIDGAIAGGLAVANKFAAGILRGPIGWDGGEITMNGFPLSTMSGAELNVVTAGFTVALAAKSPVKIVMMDELSMFDDENKGKLISNLCQLVDDGTIDQFILIDTREPVVPSEVCVMGIK